VAVGLDADRIHAPNEYVDLSRLLRGAESTAYLWEELAAPRGDDPPYPPAALSRDIGQSARLDGHDRKGGDSA
jgi:hypothetical protein